MLNQEKGMIKMRKDIVERLEKEESFMKLPEDTREIVINKVMGILSRKISSNENDIMMAYRSVLKSGV